MNAHRHGHHRQEHQQQVDTDASNLESKDGVISSQKCASRALRQDAYDFPTVSHPRVPAIIVDSHGQPHYVDLVPAYDPPQFSAPNFDSPFPPQFPADNFNAPQFLAPYFNNPYEPQFPSSNFNYPYEPQFPSSNFNYPYEPQFPSSNFNNPYEPQFPASDFNTPRFSAPFNNPYEPQFPTPTYDNQYAPPAPTPTYDNRHAPQLPSPTNDAQPPVPTATNDNRYAPQFPSPTNDAPPAPTPAFNNPYALPGESSANWANPAGRGQPGVNAADAASPQTLPNIIRVSDNSSTRARADVLTDPTEAMLTRHDLRNPTTFVNAIERGQRYLDPNKDGLLSKDELKKYVADTTHPKLSRMAAQIVLENFDTLSQMRGGVSLDNLKQMNGAMARGADSKDYANKVGWLSLLIPNGGGIGLKEKAEHWHEMRPFLDKLNIFDETT